MLQNRKFPGLLNGVLKDSVREILVKNCKICIFLALGGAIAFGISSIWAFISITNLIPCLIAGISQIVSCVLIFVIEVTFFFKNSQVSQLYIFKLTEIVKTDQSGFMGGFKNALVDPRDSLHLLVDFLHCDVFRHWEPCFNVFT